LINTDSDNFISFSMEGVINRGVVYMQNKVLTIRDQKPLNHRLNVLLSAYQGFLTAKGLVNSEFSRLIFVENYTQTLKFKLYDDELKKQLIDELERFSSF